MAKSFAASPAQRRKVAGQPCAICLSSPCDPAHLIDRSLTTIGQDDPLAVIPLCRTHHRRFDENGLDILPALEPHYRPELAFAVQRVGLAATYRRVTNRRSVV